MFIQKDLTTDNINNIDDSPLYMVNDLIFTSAGELVKVVVKPMGNCECGDCGDCNDWVSGDNIQW